VSRQALLEIRGKVRLKLGLDTKSYIFNPEIEDEIDQSIKMLNRQFEVLKTSYSGTTADNEPVILLPVDLAKVTALDIEDDPLDYVPATEIDDLGENIDDVEQITWTEDL